jgi:hypothetical protein
MLISQKSRFWRCVSATTGPRPGDRRGGAGLARIRCLPSASETIFVRPSPTQFRDRRFRDLPHPVSSQDKRPAVAWYALGVQNETDSHPLSLQHIRVKQSRLNPRQKSAVPCPTCDVFIGKCGEIQSGAERSGSYVDRKAMNLNPDHRGNQ